MDYEKTGGFDPNEILKSIRQSKPSHPANYDFVNHSNVKDLHSIINRDITA